ncbi:hypothetical protein [Streptomyces sp. CBMA123]|uniref:hypothetical protein n=1 Tax=Streptomyces sp. CBMA123 TaxID=1896313 RepID=UPI001661A742|nr:hypothetical protein [Streptomyces sp. CBMA123]MBD0690400.1 hypothetical protein [Streptomyces sp. CBMA123]
MTHYGTPGQQTPGQPHRRNGRAGRAGDRQGKNDAPWPRRPLLTALWIPAAAVLLPLGGALGAFGAWFLLPSLGLVLAGAIGLIYTLVCLCQSGVLRVLALALLVAPLVAVPLLSMNTTQSTVLSMRGTTHPGTVVAVRVIHGKTTSYSCAVRYDGAPERTESVSCGSADTAGERVSVTEDPDGLVDPEFTESAENPRFDLAMVGTADVSLIVISAVAAGVGALLYQLRERRNRVARASA